MMQFLHNAGSSGMRNVGIAAGMPGRPARRDVEMLRSRTLRRHSTDKHAGPDVIA